jgi:hypothetical protein
MSNDDERNQDSAKDPVHIVIRRFFLNKCVQVRCEIHVKRHQQEDINDEHATLFRAIAKKGLLERVSSKESTEE